MSIMQSASLAGASGSFTNQDPEGGSEIAGPMKSSYNELLLSELKQLREEARRSRQKQNSL